MYYILYVPIIDGWNTRYSQLENGRITKLPQDQTDTIEVLFMSPIGMGELPCQKCWQQYTGGLWVLLLWIANSIYSHLKRFRLYLMSDSLLCVILMREMSDCIHIVGAARLFWSIFASPMRWAIRLMLQEQISPSSIIHYHLITLHNNNNNNNNDNLKKY